MFNMMPKQVHLADWRTSDSDLSFDPNAETSWPSRHSFILREPSDRYWLIHPSLGIVCLQTNTIHRWHSVGKLTRSLTVPYPKPHGPLTIALLNPQGNITKDYDGINTHVDMGGQLVYVGELAKAMALRGVNAVVATRRFRDDRYPKFNQVHEMLAETETARATVLRMPGDGGDSFIPKEHLWPILDSWARQLAVYWTVNGELPHALTSHYGDGGFTATLLQQYIGVPHATFTAHSLGAQKLESLRSDGQSKRCTSTTKVRLNMDQRLAAERLSMCSARRIVVSTDVERTEQYSHPLYRRAVDFEDVDRFTTVAPGVNCDVFDPNCDSDDDQVTIDRLRHAMMRDLCKWRHNLPLIVLAGRMEPKKNHVRVVEAFAKNALLRSRANLLLLLPGGPDALRCPEEAFRQGSVEYTIASQLQILSKTHGLQGQVVVAGLENTQQQLAAMFRFVSGNNRRGVLASVSLFEPFGLLPLEAAYAGLPVVVGDRGGVVESLRQKLPDGSFQECAVFVNPFDADDISRGLVRMISSAGVWERCRDAGRRRVERFYTWPSAAKRYIDIVQSVLLHEHGDVMNEM